LNLLLHHDFTLPPRQAAELIWSRFVNTKGQQGTNIPNDLHMEHLNRLVKTAIQGLGVDKTERAITRVGKVLRVSSPLLDNFDSENGVAKGSGKHGKPSEEKDIKIVLKDISSVFKVFPKRAHNFFPDPRHPLRAKPLEDLKEWIVNHLSVGCP
jgi:L1 cell adhesion molecule like protein